MDNKITEFIASYISLTGEGVQIIKDQNLNKYYENFTVLLQRVPLYHMASCLEIAPCLQVECEIKYLLNRDQLHILILYSKIQDRYNFELETLGDQGHFLF